MIASLSHDRFSFFLLTRLAIVFGDISYFFFFHGFSKKKKKFLLALGRVLPT